REISPNGTVSFTVHPLNDPPVAFTGSAFVQDNKVDTIPPNTVELYAGNNLPLDERATLLGDDVDPDNDSTDLIYTVDSLPVKGILSSVVGGIATELTAGDLPLTVTDVMSLRYQPNVDENGTDTFLFSVQDIIGVTTQGQANLTIGTPQWTPPLNWIAPDLGGGVHPFFYLLTIQGGGLPAPLVGEIRDLDTTDNIVTVQPEFYFGAGSAGLLPGDYTFSWEYFNDDPTVNAFVEGESDVAVTVDDYGQPTVPNAPVVTEPAGRAVERNRIFTFLPENAAGWIMVIERMDGGDWVDFLTLTESFSRDTSADELPAFPLNVTVSKTLFFTEPGTYQATVRGFNPLAPMPARGESDAHSDLFSDYSATFTVAAASPTDIAEKLPAPENLLAQLIGDEGDKTVRLTWTGVTSLYRVHLRARRGARILLTRAMRVNGTGITMPRTAEEADQLVANGVVPEADARLLLSLEKIFGDPKLAPDAYDWSVITDGGDGDFSPWALVNNRLARFTVNAPLSDNMPGALLELVATFDLDTAVLGLVDVTFTATVDPGLPVDSVTVVIGEPRKDGLRRTLSLAPGTGDT
ncbi:MAG: Ig-like domain-containing protein, partial [Lentisphaeria bacterium]